ncbi:hypothetical protein MTO96_001209 [Rhipicephalus appendiculatus]
MRLRTVIVVVPASTVLHRPPVPQKDLSSDAEGLSVLTVAGPARAGIFVDVFIAGKSLNLLVDSGSSVSILEESIFKQYFANESLLSAPRVKLLDYSKRCIPVRGCFFTEVTFKGRTVYLLFYVVAKGTSILGIDAIRILDLHIEGSSLHCFETSTMPATLDAAQLSGSFQVSPTNSLPETLSSEFGSLFGPGLGFAKGFVHRLKTRLDVFPVTSKLRRLPLTL